MKINSKTFQATSHTRKFWTLLRKRSFKRETDSLLIAAQSSAIRTKYVRAKIDKTQQNRRYRLCGDKIEMINYIISEFSKLAQNVYKTWWGR